MFHKFLIIKSQILNILWDLFLLQHLQLPEVNPKLEGPFQCLSCKDQPFEIDFIEETTQYTGKYCSHIRKAWIFRGLNLRYEVYNINLSLKFNIDLL